MTQQPTYEFEEDDAPKPERKAFIPGLEPLAPTAPAAPAGASAGGPPTAGAPAAPVARSAPVPRPAAPPVAPEADDPDLKPGSRKDLWPCPHCGTRNKPDRTNCRTCGKLPTDAKDTPAWQKPQVIAVAVGAVLVLFLIWLLTRPNLSMKPPGPSSVDSKVRRGSAQTLERELVGKTFTPKGRLAVTGRICASRPLPGADGVTTVVLLLGTNASDDGLAEAKVVFNGERVENLPPHAAVLNLITDTKLDLTPGAYLSVVGDYGQLADGAQLVRSAEDGDSVAVEQLRQ